MKKTGKKMLALLIVLIMCVSLFPMSAFAAELNKLIFDVDSVTAVMGSTTQVKISLKNNPGVSSIKLLVDYDRSLTLTDVKYNTEMGGQTMNPSSMSSPVTLIWVNPFGEFKGDTTFATLTFVTPSNVDDTYVANISVTYDENDIYNLNEDNVPSEVNNGSVTIFAGVPGDINGDGVLNNKDLTRLFQYLASWDVSVNQAALDVNGDGSVNNKDLTRLFQYLAGWDVDIYIGSKTQHKHTISTVAAKEAGCATDGNKEYYACYGCGKYFSDSAAKNEISLESVIVKQKGHTVVVDQAVAPTSSTTGLTEGSHCSVCNAILVPQDVVPIPASDQYAITYHIANGDSYLSTVDITNSNATQYDSNKGYTLKNIEVPGYVFLGWYDLPAGSNAENVKKIPAGETGEIDLYAHWEKIKYSVQFESDLVPVDDITYTVDKGATLPIPSLSGYNFVGWSNDEGEILKVIPVGTTGNKIYKANWLSERNKALTKSNLEPPIIIEDDETNTILFTYEVGKIENVPLYNVKDFGYVNSDGITKTETVTYRTETSETYMSQATHTVADSTTNSQQWALSSGWSDSTSCNSSYLEQHNMTKEQAKQICTTDGTNWLISKGSSGSSTTTTYDSSQDYDLNTTTKNTKTFDTQTGTTNHKESSELDLELSAEMHVGTKLAGSSVSASIGTKTADENSNSFSTNTGTEGDEGSNEQKGSIRHSGTDSTNTASWNNSSSYGGSSSLTKSDTLKNSVSETIANTYGYGKNYILNENRNETQGISSTSSNSDSYTSSLTYDKSTGIEETITVTTANTKTGYHRFIKAGTAHVFAVVGYDIAASSYFVNTFVVMDDEVHDFEDYSYSSAAYNDNQTGVITFEVPYDVEEYVLSRVGETDGLEVNSAGVITGYSGSEKLVVIPEYHAVDNRDESNRVVKITGISSDAFKNNTNITGVVLSEFITTIPSNAFDGCTSLSYIDLSNVTSIGSEAFKNTKLNAVYLSNKVVSIGSNAFENYDVIGINAGNANAISEVVNSGAKEIIVYVSSNYKDFNDYEIVVPNTTEKFVFNGRGNEFVDFSIICNAETTIINNATFKSTKKTPLTISSSNVELGQVDVTSSGIAMMLTAPTCNLGLYGESALSSTSGNAMLSRNIIVSKTADANKNGVYSELEVSGDILLNGTIDNQSMVNCNGHITIINDDEYTKYLNGVYTLTYNARGGSLDEESKTIYYGKEIGELPTPTLTGFSFVGWYTDKTGGTKITAETISTFEANTTVYAHWSTNAYKATWSTVTGCSISVNRTSSPNKGASTGIITSGETVYYGDVLSITYTASTGYSISTKGATSITVTGNVTKSDIYATTSVNSYTASWSTGTGYSISVNRTSSPKANAPTGLISSGSKVYYGDVLSVTYTASTGYSISKKGATSITVTGNVTKDDIYATATANKYTYKVVCKSSNGTNLGSTEVTYAYGTTNTITPPAKSGYTTPAAQSVIWDSTSAKTITFIYTPTPGSVGSASGQYNSSPVQTYSAKLEYRNRTANSVEVRVNWSATIQTTGYSVYGQRCRATINGTYYNADAVPFNGWQNTSTARTQSAATSWVKVSLSTTNRTTVSVPIYIYSFNSNGTDMVSYGAGTASATLTATIPAY